MTLFWASLDAKVTRLDERLTEMKEAQAEPLCLAVLTTQMKAMERGNDRIRGELRTLNRQFCPSPQPAGGAFLEASMEQTAEEKLRHWPKRTLN